MDRLTVEAVQKHQPALLSRMRVEFLAHGNLTEESALALMSKVEDQMLTFDVKPPTKTQKPLQRSVMLNENSHYVYTTTTEVHKDSCISVFYQCGGLRSTRSNATIELFSQLTSEPCFNVLRTEEQLGYVVWSYDTDFEGAQGFKVVVQSERHPTYLDTRIEAFLDSMEDHIENMGEEEFERHKASLIQNRLEKPKMLGTRTRMLWSEIEGEQYNFDRDRIEAEEIGKLTKEDILAFYQRFISRESREAI